MHKAEIVSFLVLDNGVLNIINSFELGNKKGRQNNALHPSQYNSTISAALVLFLDRMVTNCPLLN